VYAIYVEALATACNQALAISQLSSIQIRFAQMPAKLGKAAQLQLRRLRQRHFHGEIVLLIRLLSTVLPAQHVITVEVLITV